MTATISFDSGSTTETKKRPLPQPSSWAASHRSSGIFEMKKVRATIRLNTENIPMIIMTYRVSVSFRFFTTR